MKKTYSLDDNGLPIAALSNSTPGTVDAFQARTLKSAEKAGWKPAWKGQVLTLTKGNLTLTIQHSEKGYVRKVEQNGKPVILPGHKQKWLKLQAMITA